MHNRTIQIQLGIGAILASGFLLLFAIPNWVSSPSNVPNIILSPLFWPNTLAGLTGIVGLGLVLTSIRSPKPLTEEPSDVDDRAAAYFRLLAMAVIMALSMFALPRLGMVWTSMLAFASVALLIRTSHPRAALISAIIMPLVLYLFFAHVAGVAIPQGLFVRLP